MIGMIVAPAFRFSNVFWKINERVNRAREENDAYLSLPPPFAGMHIMVKTDSLTVISVMPLRSEDEAVGELRITIQCLNTLYYIAEINIEGFAGDNNFFTLKARAWAGKTVVYDLIQL